MTKNGLTGDRRLLQITLGILTGIPFVSGLVGMITGPATLPGGQSDVTPTLDSEYRFVMASWFAVAPVIWSTLPRIEEKTSTLRMAMGVVFIDWRCGPADLVAQGWKTSSDLYPGHRARANRHARDCSMADPHRCVGQVRCSWRVLNCHLSR